jgi:hypothetical protein
MLQEFNQQLNAAIERKTQLTKLMFVAVPRLEEARSINTQ